MKHIIISAALSAVTLISTGCSGFLDEEMKSTLVQIIHILVAMVLSLLLQDYTDGPVLNLTPGEKLQLHRVKHALTKCSKSLLI